MTSAVAQTRPGFPVSDESLLVGSVLLSFCVAIWCGVLAYALEGLGSRETVPFSLAVAGAFAGLGTFFAACWKPEVVVHLVLIGVILDQWERLGFIGIPFLTVSKAVVLEAVLLLVCRFLFSLRRPPFLFPTVALAHLPFSLVCLVSTFAFSFSLKNSLRWLIAPVTLPIMAIVLTQFVDGKKVALRLTKAFAVYSFFPMGVAALETITQVHVLGPAELVSYGVNNIFRVAGNFENPNDFVVLMLFSIPLLLLWGLQTPSWRARILLFAGALFESFILLKTYSRSGYVSMGFVFVTMVFLGRKKIRWFAVLCCLGGVLGIMLIPEVRDRLLTLIGIRSGSVGLAQAFGSIDIRRILLLAAWGEFTQHPILGIGFANLGFRVKSYSTLAEGSTAENTYLEVLAELGVVGFLAFSFFLLVAWKALLRGLRECRGDQTREAFYVALACGYCGFAFNNLLDTNLQDNLPWVLLPILVQLGRPVPEDS